MDGIYKVNLIPSDLSVEETVLQIADTLDNLNGIVDDVFSRIISRIDNNLDKTNKLQKRIDVSWRKVEKLTGMQKAIKVFSSAKYPASIKHENYQSVFGIDGYKHEPKKVVLRGKTHGQSNDKGVQEKLHFYHVKVAQTKPPNKQDFKLSSVIDNIVSVGDLLVFNTDESVYLGTTTKVSPYVPKLENVESKSLLEAAPTSITNRDVMKRETDEYMYAPGMGMVPELEMPLDLPHLPGIAGDVQYSIANDGSIAPSVVTSPIGPTSPIAPIVPEDLPDLPDLPDVTSELKVEESATLPDLATAPVAAPIATLPSPPIPPPPPPPPPPTMPELPPMVEVKREAKSPQSPPVGDSRANLMDAIRKAGGAGRANLKSTANVPAKDSKAASGGDLMADLHAKLSMRRRGISGVERSGGSVLHTLASVIPEPGESSTPQRSSSEDEWE